jgi:hypothetical protein
MIAAIASALFLALTPQDPPAASPPAGPTGQDAVLADIVVDGRRLEEASRTFIEQVGAPPPGTRGGRWNSDICLSVSGMQPQFAQLMIDRISVTALEAGVDLKGPGCRPNVIIMATNDGAALATRMVDEAGLGFQPSISATNLGRAALRRFRTSDAPVRWWHVTMPVMADTGQLAIGLRGEAPPTVTVRDASRLRSNVRYDIGWVIIVVDMSRTGTATFGALSDYVAMVALTQADATADLGGEDTILNLFQPDAAVTGLTALDRDYLTALYSARTDRANAGQQVNDLVDRLVSVRRAGEETPPSD